MGTSISSLINVVRGQSKMRAALMMAAFVAILVEGLFIASYLPTVREGVESDGAILLLLGTMVMFFGLWSPTTKLKYRNVLAGILILFSGAMLLLAYFFMIRW